MIFKIDFVKIVSPNLDKLPQINNLYTRIFFSIERKCGFRHFNIGREGFDVVGIFIPVFIKNNHIGDLFTHLIDTQSNFEEGSFGINWRQVDHLIHFTPRPGFASIQILKTFFINGKDLGRVYCLLAIVYIRNLDFFIIFQISPLAFTIADLRE